MRIWVCYAALVAALLLSRSWSVAAQTTGDAQAGRALWTDYQSTQCVNCHGSRGEGGFGPDLAGRHLTAAQVTRALRNPWGIMPAFAESQISDGDVANFVAYLDSLPAPAQPGRWRYPLPAGATHGQELLLATIGCAQCHAPLLANPREVIGAMGPSADFEWFKTIVYDHVTVMPEQFRLLGDKPTPRIRMGNYSKIRLPETLLHEVWTYLTEDLGRRARVEGEFSAGVPAANGVTYTLTVGNSGIANKGLPAEDLTIAVALPAGAAVVATTGAGYEGVRPDEQAKASVAVWKLPRLAAREEQHYTITLARPATKADNLRGTIRWMKPAVKPGPSDSVNIAPAPTSEAAP